MNKHDLFFKKVMENETLVECLKNLETKKWDKLFFNEKVNLFKTIVDEITGFYPELGKPKFEFIFMETNEAGEESAKGTYINIRMLEDGNHFEVLFTVLHEIRHFFQRAAAAIYEKTGKVHELFTKEELEEFIVNMARSSLLLASNYIDVSDMDRFEYAIQPIEYDAENFAYEFTKRLSKNFLTDYYDVKNCGFACNDFETIRKMHEGNKHNIIDFDRIYKLNYRDMVTRNQPRFRKDKRDYDHYMKWLEKINYLDDTKLFILAGCETAMGMYNITRDIVDAGAEAAIGWMTTVMQGSHTNWLERFCDKLAVGYTVKEAKNYADSYIYIDSKVKNGYIYGNTSTVITSSSSTYALNYSNRQTSVSDDREIQLDNNINAISELTEGSLEDKIVSALSINGIDINIQDFKIVQTGSIIDLIYLVNGAETECGYTIFTDGGEVTDIYNNMNSYNQVSTFSLRDDNQEVEVTDDMKQEYFNCSAEKLNVDYIVIEQSGKVIYDTDSNTYYYCVITDYQVNSSGAYGSVGDYYEIN